MKLISLTLARNEDWILGVSARMALRWCDELVILDHSSTDRTPAIIEGLAAQNPGRVHRLAAAGSRWEEMVNRQATLDEGRRRGGTHFAIADCDELLTANLLPQIRDWIAALAPGRCLELPMVPCWRSLDQYRDDDSVWSRARITLAFCDRPGLAWRPPDGYQHHHRAPWGAAGSRPAPVARGAGGVMHLQFAHWPRLTAKHAWYKVTEQIRWPGRRSVAELDRMYSQALDERGLRLSPVPPEWWIPEDRAAIDLASEPWQAAEARRLVAEHGRERFAGLDLFGVA